MRTRRLGVLAVGFAVMAGVSAVPGTAHAASVTVPCDASSLQSAIAGAASGTTVTLTSGCVYNYSDAAKATSDSALPHIAKTLKINGNGATIQRDPAASTQFRVLTIDPPGDLTISNVTVQRGNELEGGGILLSASGAALKASNVTVVNNVAVNGGGITDRGTLTFTGGAINANTAGFAGGGLKVDGGSAILKSTSISNNLVDDAVGQGFASAGGLLVGSGSTVSLTGTHVDNNTANAHNGQAAQGGGIESDITSATFTISSSTVDFNRAYGNGQGGFGGGITSFGPLKVTSSHLDYNTASDATVGGKGGGFFSDGGAATIGGSTVTHNQAAGPGADGGGIFRSMGTVTIPNTNVSTNDPNNCGNPSTVTGCT